METGLCCRWISALAKSCGCDVLVGNARKLAAIWKSKQKNDEKDALLIAELARTSTLLFHPVELRDDERHEMVQIIELRAVAVSQRTQTVNSVRGLCKAHGVFIKKCDASCFHKVAGCFDLLAVQVTLKSLLQHHSSKASILWQLLRFNSHII